MVAFNLTFIEKNKSFKTNWSILINLNCLVSFVVHKVIGGMELNLF